MIEDTSRTRRASSKITSSPPATLYSFYRDIEYFVWFAVVVVGVIAYFAVQKNTADTTAISFTHNIAIMEGSKIPSASLKEDNVMEASVNLSAIPGKSIVLFPFKSPNSTDHITTVIIVGVPGAFTPTCSNQVPSYSEHASTFASKGVQGIYVVSVNDAFITKAWKKSVVGEDGPKLIHFLADDTGSWTKEAGLELDMTPVLGGHRSKRYAAIVEGGVVKKIFVEENPSLITVSHAEKVLEHL